MKHWAGIGLLIAIAIVGLVLRGPDLAHRPLHNDEAINASKLERLWTQGHYRYDPDEFHGPVLYYFSLPVIFIASRLDVDQPSIVAMRTVTVLFGLGLILLLAGALDALGRASAVAAGALVAISPAMVYYSRYFIHEVPLIFFTAFALISFWRYLRRPGWTWAMAAGAGVGFMYGTKETFVFSVLAAVLAFGLTLLSRRKLSSRASRSDGTAANQSLSESSNVLRSPSWGTLPVKKRVGHLLAAIGAGAVISLIFFTSLFSEWGGAVDAVHTYFIWLKRAGGASPHVHPWYFYLQRLFWFHQRNGPVWTELSIAVLAGAGILISCLGWKLTATQRAVGLFVTWYSFLLAAIYSVLPYKTPWCFLGFYHGFILLAGLGAGHLVTVLRPLALRIAAILLIAVAAGHLVWESRRCSTEFAADPRNPYVYGHTSADALNLLERVEELARLYPAGAAAMPIQVIAPESNYWPLPWYWRKYNQAGWWDHIPENPFSPVIVVANRLGAALDERSDKAWLMVGMFELRPRYFVELYVESGLWKQFLAARAAQRAAEAE